MRIIHTADWHLGRIFYGVHLTSDQAYVLDQFVNLVREAKPDAVVIAGDVYDRAVPPSEAVSLLDETLSRLVIDLKTRVILIAGNHDSPERLGFGTRLLSQSGLHVAGRVGLDPAWTSVTDTHSTVSFCAIPYAEPALVRERLGNPDILDHAAAMRAMIAKARETRPRGTRSVLVAHALVIGGEESESERPLSVGGTGAMASSVFDGFSFVALGHLHRPQRVGNDRIHYSGSLLQYSFSEAAHSKSVNLVELDAGGQCRVERIPLIPRRAVRCVTGTLEGMLNAPVGNDADDYLSVTLLDKGPVFDPIGRLRAKYPNVLELKRAELLARSDLAAPRVDYRTLSDRQIFTAFFQKVREETASEDEINAYLAVVERLHASERESQP